MEKKQTERKKDVEEKQNEIKLSLSEEHKTVNQKDFICYLDAMIVHHKING